MYSSVRFCHVLWTLAVIRNTLMKIKHLEYGLLGCKYKLDHLYRLMQTRPILCVFHLLADTLFQADNQL